MSFSNGLPAYCSFHNGWFCSYCDKVTEHHKSKLGFQMCNVCNRQVNLHPTQRFNALRSPEIWRFQRIVGIDYMETFGCDQKGEPIYHNIVYRKLPSSLRTPEECGIWIDGKQVLGFEGMQRVGFPIQKHAYSVKVTSKENKKSMLRTIDLDRMEKRAESFRNEETRRLANDVIVKLRGLEV